jgi:hypothetical protein
MNEGLDSARMMRRNAMRLRGVACGLEPRLAADLMHIALDLDKEAIELETAFYAKRRVPANDERVA